MLKLKIGKKTEKTEEEKAKELIKKREKQRKKMIRTRYGQKRKVHAKKGIQSCIVAVINILLLIWMIVGSFRAKGDISVLVGILAIVVLAMTVRGLTYAIRGFRERDKNYITCKVGGICNGVLLLCMCAIFIRGLF